MGQKARQYKESDIKKLFAFSGNQCAEPSCNKAMISIDNENVLGKICHIAAAGENGPRYDPTMDDDDRRSFNNLILLCDEHHTMIDNMNTIDQFSSSLLNDWKVSHMSSFENNMLPDELINKAIHELAKSISVVNGKNFVIGDVNTGGGPFRLGDDH